MRISDWSSDVCSSDLITHEKLRSGYGRRSKKRRKIGERSAKGGGAAVRRADPRREPDAKSRVARPAAKGIIFGQHQDDAPVDLGQEELVNLLPHPRSLPTAPAGAECDWGMPTADRL